MSDETQTQQVSQPAEDLKHTTDELIKDSLANAKDNSLPWYKRVSYYIGAIVLIVLYYLGDKFGPEMLDKIGELIKAIAG